MGLSGTVAPATLTVEQLASHTHEYKKPNMLGEIADYGHISGGPVVDPLDGQLTDSSGGSQSHTHALSGASNNASSLPPFYTLALIMRCA